MSEFAPGTAHQLLLDRAPRQLRYTGDLGESHRQAVRAKLSELLGTFESPPANFAIESETRRPDRTEYRITFESEPGSRVPCRLCLPSGVENPPLAIVLQGHTPGVRISMAEPQTDFDRSLIESGDRDFALQALGNGYAVLAIEQRCFGERWDPRQNSPDGAPDGCRLATMTALLLGRTMIGERVHDVRCALDMLALSGLVGLDRVAIVGQSGGGTVAYYAACLEPRISALICSGAFCSIAGSIAVIDHCPDNTIPHMLQWFELADLGVLLAPRPFVAVVGEQDPIFPISASREAAITMNRIYTDAGCPDKFHFAVGPGGHRFYADLAWPALAMMGFGS